MTALEPDKPRPDDEETPAGPSREWSWPTIVSVGGAAVTTIMALVSIGACLGAQDQTELTSEVQELRRQIDGLSDDIEDLTGNLSDLNEQMSGVSDNVTSQNDAPTDVEGVAATPVASPGLVGRKITGVSGAVDDYHIGRPTFCQNWSEDRNPVYDPEKFTVSVAESLKNNGILPCGTFVRVYHTLPNGTTISQDAVIADIFPDPPGFDPDSEVAYKFNVSDACGAFLQIVGLRSVTVEIISTPSETPSKP